MEAARDAHALLAEMGRLLGELEDLLGAPAADLSASPFSAPPHPIAADLSASPFSAPPHPIAADLSAGPFSAPPHPIAADLSAGPFTATAEVELFGARLRALAGVVDVVHRGFAGERALFEVDLGVPR